MSRNPVLYKSLVIGVIVLFIGVGIQPAFANNIDNVDDVSKDNSTPINQEVYENTNCFVIGVAVATKKFFSIIHDENYDFGILTKILCFGFATPSDSIVSIGTIYTIGAQGQWSYDGVFIGGLGDFKGFYMGIRDFHGFYLGGLLPIPPHMSFFIGFAKEVKIKFSNPV